MKYLQKIVEDYIQVTYPSENLVGIVCNDEGKIMGLPLNRYVPESNDTIVVTFLVCELSEMIYHHWIIGK